MSIAETVAARPPSGTQVAEWQVIDLMERADSAARQADGSFRVARDAAGGCFLYGPFWRLNHGPYQLTISCRAGPPLVAAAVVLGVEVIGEMRLQLAWRDFTAEELAGGIATAEFVVPPALSQDAGGGAIFEFRLFHYGNAGLSVDSILLHRVDVATASVAPQRWRLSGWPDPNPRPARRRPGLHRGAALGALGAGSSPPRADGRFAGWALPAALRLP